MRGFESPEVAERTENRACARIDELCHATVVIVAGVSL
jgi:hypothetical protein